MLGEVPRLAVHRHHDLGRTHLYISISSGRPGWPETWTCAWRSVTIRTPRSDSWFMIRPIATSLPGMMRRREDDRVALAELHLVIAERDPAERRARLALPARGDDQHLAPRQAHRLVEADRRREVAEVTGRLRHAEDAVEAARQRTPAAGFMRYAADRLQPRGVGREGRDEHPAVGLHRLREKALVDALLASPTACPGRRWSNRTPRRARRSSPIAVSTSVSGASPSTGVSSIFQSPVWKMLPNGVSISRPLPSGIECESATKLTRNGPSSMLRRARRR